MLKRAVIITVGDEILAGYTLDSNSHWMSAELRRRSVAVVGRETVPDHPAAIAASLRRHLGLDDVDVVFVVGGIGPTPDDRTYEGVADGLGVRLVVTDENRATIEARVKASGYGTGMLESQDQAEPLLRMVRLPEGATPIANPVGAALGTWFERRRRIVIVLPGVPEEMKAMMRQTVLDRLDSKEEREFTAEWKARGQEVRWYRVLTRLEREFPDVRIGSYPQGLEGRILFRLAGPKASVEHALSQLKAFTPD